MRLEMIKKYRRRTLTWVRGLKQHTQSQSMKVVRSHPYMGAWIETTLDMKERQQLESHPYMGAWIETFHP